VSKQNLLLTPVQVGDLRLSSRVVMSPLTRARAEAGHVPGKLVEEYYAQRAGAGLIIAECTMTAVDGSAFANEPGIYSLEQIAAWKKVVDAVHARGGLIALQIWHPGRATHALLNGGVTPISSAAKRNREGQVHTSQGALDYPVPRRLDDGELAGVVELFRAGAENARDAGFDAIEVHGAHGYLLDQFLRDSVNDRDGEYGGSIENRARLLFEVVDAVIGVFGAGRTGVRISPLVGFNDISDSDPRGLVQHVAEQLARRGAAFLDLRHADYADPAEQELARIARAAYSGTLMRNGGFDQASGEAALAAGGTDAIIYGKPFIANPDLVERFRQGAALAPVDFATLYTQGPKGYTDYPALDSAGDFVTPDSVDLTVQALAS
jgi:N-ethylmaleimide reductase